MKNLELVIEQAVCRIEMFLESGSALNKDLLKGSMTALRLKIMECNDTHVNEAKILIKRIENILRNPATESIQTGNAEKELHGVTVHYNENTERYTPDEPERTDIELLDLEVNGVSIWHFVDKMGIDPDVIIDELSK